MILDATVAEEFLSIVASGFSAENVQKKKSLFINRLESEVMSPLITVYDDGLLEGEQYNTLDASWYGQIAWLSSLYVAAVRADAAMAREMGDADFAARCDRIAASGSRLIAERLLNGEYFVQKIDPAHSDAINTNEGCHIDQVYGQSWALPLHQGSLRDPCRSNSGEIGLISGIIRGP